MKYSTAILIAVVSGSLAHIGLDNTDSVKTGYYIGIIMGVIISILAYKINERN